MENNITNLTLSLSKAKTFESCALKYKYTYIDKLPRKEYDFHILGKFVHKVLEDFHKYYLEGCQEPFNKSILKAYKGALAEYSAKMTAEMKIEVYKMIASYLKRIYSEYSDGTMQNILSCEQNFRFEIVDEEKSIAVVLNGQIDRVQKDPDGIIHVVDYKTTKNKKYLTNDFFQLMTYAFVLLHEDPSLEKIRGSYMLVRHDFEMITTEFEKKEILKVKEKYIEYAKKIIEEKLYKPNPTVLCNWCDHIDICSAGKPMMLNQNMKFGETSW